MGKRLVESVRFLGAAIFLLEVAGRLTSEQRAGWGWFLLAGLILAGIAVNLRICPVHPPVLPQRPRFQLA